jgi:hypothetical protein
MGSKPKVILNYRGNLKMICLSRQIMESEFEKYINKIFKLPEVENAKVRDVIIDRANKADTIKKAFDIGYHDCYSDIDFSIMVRLPKNGSISADEYTKGVDRFGVNEDTALGWAFVPENQMYRIIFKNGMRYDFGFDFEYVEDDLLKSEIENSQENKSYKEIQNEHWPIENINRFWFVQIQALGKLYRKDYLISSHLANMNCNETLVMQMVLRDIKYGTNHHRYGYSEELEYVKYLGKSPYKTDDITFNRISEHIYAAALAYDRLAKEFYPKYKERSSTLFEIWDYYHKNIF